MSMGVLTFSRLNLPRVNGKLKRKKRGSTKWKTLLQSCQINLLPNINCVVFFAIYKIRRPKTLEYNHPHINRTPEANGLKVFQVKYWKKFCHNLS